jgi:hypothetical protein
MLTTEASARGVKIRVGGALHHEKRVLSMQVLFELGVVAVDSGKIDFVPDEPEVRSSSSRLGRGDGGGRGADDDYDNENVTRTTYRPLWRRYRCCSAFF